MPRRIEEDHENFRNIMKKTEDLRKREELPGVWIVREFEDHPSFFTYLPLSDVWIPPIIENNKQSDWFVGALDEIGIEEEKNKIK